jgi:hypothetical protein
MALVAGLVACGLVACSTASPTQGTYALQFPSTAAAIATDRMQVQVFEAKDETTCAALLSARRSGQPLPATPIAETSVKLCTAFAGAGIRALDVGYGRRAFLVLGQRSKEPVDFLVGCTVDYVASDSPPVSIFLSLVSPDTPVPATDCPSIDAFCVPPSRKTCNAE